MRKKKEVKNKELWAFIKSCNLRDITRFVSGLFTVLLTVFWLGRWVTQSDVGLLKNKKFEAMIYYDPSKQVANGKQVILYYDYLYLREVKEEMHEDIKVLDIKSRSKKGIKSIGKIYTMSEGNPIFDKVKKLVTFEQKEN